MTSLLTMAEYAKLIGKSRQSVFGRIKSGSLPAKKIKNRWFIDPKVAKDNPQVNNNILGNGGEGVGNDDKDDESPLTKEKIRTQRATADIKEMEAKEKAGKLIDVEVVKKQAFTAGRNVREAFQNLPARISAELACETDPHRVESKLENEIRIILENLSY